VGTSEPSNDNKKHTTKSLETIPSNFKICECLTQWSADILKTIAFMTTYFQPNIKPVILDQLFSAYFFIF
jgi:hypothetical protein